MKGLRQTGEMMRNDVKGTLPRLWNSPTIHILSLTLQSLPLRPAGCLISAWMTASLLSKGRCNPKICSTWHFNTNPCVEFFASSSIHSMRIYHPWLTFGLHISWKLTLKPALCSMIANQLRTCFQILGYHYLRWGHVGLWKAMSCLLVILEGQINFLCRLSKRCG